MGAIEKNILRQIKRSGEPIPDRIANKPRLFAGGELFIAAFYDLDSERPPAFQGCSPIPWSAIHTYAVAHDMTGELYEDLLYHIRALDNAFMKHMQGRQKQQQGTGNGDAARPRTPPRRRG